MNALLVPDGPPRRPAARAPQASTAGGCWESSGPPCALCSWCPHSPCQPIGPTRVALRGTWAACVPCRTCGQGQPGHRRPQSPVPPHPVLPAPGSRDEPPAPAVPPQFSPRPRSLLHLAHKDTEPLLSPAEHLLCISGYMCSILLGGRKKASAAYRVCKPPRSFPVACVLHSSYLCTPEEAWPCPPPWLTSRQPSSLLLLSVEAEQEAVQTPVPHRGLSRGRRSV